MSERRYMRFTPVDICHRMKTRLKHTCVNVDQAIRTADADLDHVIDEIDDIMDSLEAIQEDLCEMFSPKEGLRDELDDMMDHIMHHLDDLHYALRDRASISGGLHNKRMKEVRAEINHAINEHLAKHHDVYGGYKLKLN